MKNEIQKLIAQGDTEKALTLLATKFPNDATMLMAQYVNGKKEFNLSMMDYSDWQRIQSRVNYSVLELAGKADVDNSNQVITVPVKQDGGHKVFISYSWDDKAVVSEVKKYLNDAGFKVIIDEDDMQAAQSILEFIQNSIRSCDVVLSIVSSKSLLSSWVGQESMASLYAIWLADKEFIPVRLDDVRFDIQFQIGIQKGIQSKLKELEDGLVELKSFPGADTRAFDEDRSKLIDMQNNIGKIMQRLKSVLTLDISGNSFLPSMKKVEDRIKSIKP